MRDRRRYLERMQALQTQSSAKATKNRCVYPETQGVIKRVTRRALALGLRKVSLLSRPETIVNENGYRKKG